jgi:hypothetical protein
VVRGKILNSTIENHQLKTCARAGQFRGERVSRIKNRVSGFDLPLKGYEVFVRFAFSDDREFVAVNEDFRLRFRLRQGYGGQVRYAGRVGGAGYETSRYSSSAVKFS